MAYKVAGHHDTNRSPSAEDLRRAFETAVCEIHQSDRAAKTTLWYRTPIVPRARFFGVSQPDAENRALTVAARALAQLWKVERGSWRKERLYSKAAGPACSALKTPQLRVPGFGPGSGGLEPQSLPTPVGCE